MGMSCCHFLSLVSVYLLCLSQYDAIVLFHFGYMFAWTAKKEATKKFSFQSRFLSHHTLDLSWSNFLFIQFEDWLCFLESSLQKERRWRWWIEFMSLIWSVSLCHHMLRCTSYSYAIFSCIFGLNQFLAAPDMAVTQVWWGYGKREVGRVLMPVFICEETWLWLILNLLYQSSSLTGELWLEVWWGCMKLVE